MHCEAHIFMSMLDLRIQVRVHGAGILSQARPSSWKQYKHHQTRITTEPKHSEVKLFKASGRNILFCFVLFYFLVKATTNRNVIENKHVNSVRTLVSLKHRPPEISEVRRHCAGCYSLALPQPCQDYPGSQGRHRLARACGPGHPGLGSGHTLSIQTNTGSPNGLLDRSWDIQRKLSH